MCVYLPHWPLQRLWHEHSELRKKPVVLSIPRPAKGSEVVLCCARAVRTGVRPGMPVAEALALQPQLHVQDMEPERDIVALKRLAEWMERFSPVVSLEEGPNPQSLLVDITGCAACFHGENKLVERAERELRNRTWTARIAGADTVGAAWGLAHFALPKSSRIEMDLEELPIAALRLPAEAIHVLLQLGIERVHQLMALPRSSLPARFGEILLARLDQAFGRIPEVIHPHRPAPETFAVYPFEYATDRMEALNLALDHLTERIHSILQSRNRGARRIECWLYHETAEPRRIETALFRPSRCVEHLRMLLRAQLERVQLSEPVASVCLRVTQAEPLSDTQADFFDADRLNQEKALADLIDRLSGRLGLAAVTRPTLVPDPQPEYAYRFDPLIQTRDVRAATVRERTTKKRRSKPLPYSRGSEKLPKRPLRFWSTPLPVEVMSVVPEGPPLRLRWAKQDYRIIQTWGPERIETGWWRGLDVHRDYYVAATHTGARFWLFRRHEDGRWFVQGCYE